MSDSEQTTGGTTEQETKTADKETSARQNAVQKDYKATVKFNETDRANPGRDH